MTPLSPERLRQVETLFHRALDRDPSERAAFLAEACAGDSQLLAEVESLIDRSGQDSGILNAAAIRRIGNYEIRSLLGAGGMGEVYRAWDTRLRREVAIKVLPEGVTCDPGRLARFEREARALASINHPNIGAIYGVEDIGGDHGHVVALVLELIEGETLAERLARTGPLPLTEAVRIAGQIVDALDAAHAKGVVHRDLKPANIKLTPTGGVKVLDFGLAKTTSGVLGHGDTQTAHTAEGMIVGTPAYMSPEQARGQSTDTRTDVWALGCVLFEMLAGAPPFTGATATDTIAAVIERDPDWSRLPNGTPSTLRRLLQATLEKDAARRLGSVADVRALLADAATADLVSGRTPSRRALIVAAAAALLLTIGFAVWRFTETVVPVAVKRSAIALPAGEPLMQGGFTVAASPDGRYLAFSTLRDGRPALYLRPMDGDAAQLVSDDNAGYPFFSPDSKWIGFFAGGKLLKQRISGGGPVVLADASTPRGGSWADGGFIVFAAESRQALSRVSADGGPVTPFTVLDTKAGETSHRYPDMLPGSHAVVFKVEGSGNDAHIDALDINTGQRQTLVNDANTFEPHYARSGHLLYLAGATVMAAPFDTQQLRLTGPAAAVQQHVQTYTLSAAGFLAYAAEDTSTRRLEWIDRHGTLTPLPLPPDRFDVPRLSPDGKRVVLSIDDRTRSGRSVWTYDLGADKLTRLTTDGANLWPVWNVDGTRVVYASNNVGTAFDLFDRPADGSGVPRPLLVKPGTQLPRDVSKDGLLVYGDGAGQVIDLWLMPLAGGGSPRRFVQAAGDPVAFSPDGRWLAYTLRESGHIDVYVGRTDGAAGRWQVSSEGGTEPRWNPNGRELFYRQGNKLIAVSVEPGNGLSFGKPQVLFDNPRFVLGIVGTNYDVDKDGQRFLAVTQDPSSDSSRSIQIARNYQLPTTNSQLPTSN